jgi:hypothetical protein
VLNEYCGQAVTKVFKLDLKSGKGWFTEPSPLDQGQMNGSERDVSDEKCRKRVLCIVACSGQALICSRNVGGGIWAVGLAANVVNARTSER